MLPFILAGVAAASVVGGAILWQAWKNQDLSAKQELMRLWEGMNSANRNYAEFWNEGVRRYGEAWNEAWQQYEKSVEREREFWSNLWNKIFPGRREAGLQNEGSPIGELLLKVREAGARGELSPEREREIIAGIGLYLTKMGVKPEELEDYLKEEARKASGGEIDSKLEEQIEKASYVVQDYLDRERARTQAMTMR